MDIVDQLKYAGDHVLFVPHLYHSAADEIEQLRKALLDAVGFVSRADNLFLKQATTDTIKGIPDGYR